MIGKIVLFQDLKFADTIDVKQATGNLKRLEVLAKLLLLEVSIEKLLLDTCLLVNKWNYTLEVTRTA